MLFSWKKKLHANSQSDRLAGKAFVMTKGTEKSWKRLFLVFSQQKILLILHTYPAYFVLISRTAGRDNILVEEMLTSTYKDLF